MCDEFSMLIATFIVFYRLLSFSQTMAAPTTLLVGLCALMLFVVVAQLSTGQSTVQQIVFTGMAYWLWHVCFKLIGNCDVEEVVKSKMKWMAITGIGRPSSRFPIDEVPSSCVTAIDLICHSVLHHGTCMLGNRLLRLSWTSGNSEKYRNALGGLVRTSWLVCTTYSL